MLPMRKGVDRQPSLSLLLDGHLGGQLCLLQFGQYLFAEALLTFFVGLRLSDRSHPYQKSVLFLAVHLHNDVIKILE
jgi:hypothetical protein